MSRRVQRRRGMAPGRRRLLAAGLAGALLCICGSVSRFALAAPKPKPVEVQLVGAADVNPNLDGRASPVVVHLYVLKDSGAFVAAGFDALTGDAITTLGDALLLREQRIVRPGESLAVTLQVDPEATYVGAVAEYADVLGAQWRAGIVAPEKRKKLLGLLSRKAVRVELGRNAVRVIVVD